MAAVRKAYEIGVALVSRVKRIFKTDSRKDAWPVAKHLFYSASLSIKKPAPTSD